MTNKLGLIVFGLSVILLSGCGSSGSSDGGTTGSSNVITEETNNIVGTWSSGCINYNDYGVSLLEIYSFNADGSGAYSFSEYDSLNCNDADKTLGQDSAMSYTIGNDTTAKDGTSALEFYTLPVEGTAYYSMLRIEGNTLFIASSEESGRDGYSAETRENDFSDVYALFKQ